MLRVSAYVVIDMRTQLEIEDTCFVNLCWLFCPGLRRSCKILTCVGAKGTDVCGELAANISRTTSTVAELCASEERPVESVGPGWGLREF